MLETKSEVATANSNRWQPLKLRFLNISLKRNEITVRSTCTSLLYTEEHWELCSKISGSTWSIADVLYIKTLRTYALEPPSRLVFGQDVGYKCFHFYHLPSSAEPKDRWISLAGCSARSKPNNQRAEPKELAAKP